MRRTGTSTSIRYYLQSERLSMQATTKHTPFFLMHGREARLPLEVEKADFIAGSKQLPEINGRIEQLTKLKEEIFPAVMANIDIAQTRQKDQYSKRKGLGQQEIKVGDTVMRLNMLKRTKKTHGWEPTRCLKSPSMAAVVSIAKQQIPH